MNAPIIFQHFIVRRHVAQRLIFRIKNSDELPSLYCINFDYPALAHSVSLIACGVLGVMCPPIRLARVFVLMPVPNLLPLLSPRHLFQHHRPSPYSLQNRMPVLPTQRQSTGAWRKSVPALSIVFLNGVGELLSGRWVRAPTQQIDATLANRSGNARSDTTGLDEGVIYMVIT